MLQEKLYDVIVVGAGFAGAVVAAKLAKEGVNPTNGERLKIALIEGGRYYRGKPNWGYGIPSRRQMFTHIQQDMIQGERSFQFRHQEGMRRDAVLTPSSQLFVGVGGGSLHWGAQGNPPDDKDYEWWVRETGVDWTKENMREAVEELLRMWHSHTIPDKMLSEYHLRFRDAAQAMGYKTQKIMVHKRNCIMCGTHIERMPGCRYDAKMSTLLSHIPIAEENGVEILPNTVAEQLIIEKKGSDWVASGLWYQERGQPPQKAMAKKIILAGYMGSVFLLYGSGYGPKDLLGDKLLVENPNVGSHIEGHPAAMMEPMIARFENCAVHEPGDGNYGFWFVDDKDSNGSERLFILSGGETTDMTFFQGAQSYALSVWAPEFGHKHKDWMRKNWKEWRYLLGTPFYYGPVVSYSHSAAPMARVLPDGSYQFDDEHPVIKKRARESYEICRTVLEKIGAKEIRSAEGRDRDRTSIRKFYHEVGACRAGVDRTNSVVNPNFECHDIANLFIVDSNTHPRVASLWSGGTVVAIVATFAAQRIIANHFRRSQL